MADLPPLPIMRIHTELPDKDIDTIHAYMREYGAICAAAAERKPMTQKEIDALLEQVGWPASMISLFIRAKLRELVRAVEAHYGIK